jgi:uncharacterized protein (TIRG00374 family)
MKISPKALRTVIVYGIAVLCLAWVLHGVRFDELWRRMRGLQLQWIPVALSLDILSTISHGLRWKLLLRPAGAVTLMQTSQAIYAGLFVNHILPMRTGEFVRGYLVSRRMGEPFTAVLPSMIMERVSDGSLFVLALALCSLFVPLPQRVANAGVIVGSVLLLAIVVLLVLSFVRKDRRASAFPHNGRRGRWGGRLSTFLDRFAGGLRSIWASPGLPSALAVSLLVMVLQALSFWSIMHAYGIRVSLWVPTVVLIIVRLGTAVPNAPANLGPYQFFCVIALALFSIDKTTATGFAIVMSIILAVPILTLGLTAFVKSGLSVSALRAGRPPKA